MPSKLDTEVRETVRKTRVSGKTHLGMPNQGSKFRGHSISCSCVPGQRIEPRTHNQKQGLLMKKEKALSRKEVALDLKRESSKRPAMRCIACCRPFSVPVSLFCISLALFSCLTSSVPLEEAEVRQGFYFSSLNGLLSYAGLDVSILSLFCHIIVKCYFTNIDADSEVSTMLFQGSLGKQVIE